MLFSLLQRTLTPQSAIAYIGAVLLIIFLVFPFREWAHAFIAYKLGDVSVKYRGRLCFNPIEHIDPLGALFLLLFGYGWSKPVPVDIRYFKKPKRDMAITALAGPLANIISAMAGGLVLNALSVFAGRFLLYNFIGNIIFAMFLNFISINTILAVFNLLPIPPLDGSKILFAFLPDNAIQWFYRYQFAIRFTLILLVFVGVLSYPINWLAGFIENFVITVTRLPFLPFIAQ